MNEPAPFSFLRVLHQLTGIAGRMPDVGDQKITVLHHVAIRPDNSQFSRYTLHPRWIKGAVKAFWHFARPFRRVVGPQVNQSYIGVPLFCLLYCLSGQPIEPSIAAHNKFCHAILQDMPLHLRDQRRQQTVCCVPMADEKARASFSMMVLPY